MPILVQDHDISGVTTVGLFGLEVLNHRCMTQQRPIVDENIIVLHKATVFEAALSRKITDSGIEVSTMLLCNAKRVGRKVANAYLYRRRDTSTPSFRGSEIGLSD